MKPQFKNARFASKPAKRREDMTPLELAYADMEYQRHIGGFGYKQARKHYERLLSKEKHKAKAEPKSA